MDLFFTGYITLFFLYGMTLFAGLMGRHGLSRLMAVPALAANGFLLMGISIISRQPPVFEIFGGMLFVTFVLGLMGLFCRRAEDTPLNVKTWVWMEILFLLSIVLFFPKVPPPHRYLHTVLWVVCFHGFRDLALSWAFFSAAHFIQLKSDPARNRVNNPLLKQGRNYLLLSAVAFLCGEYSGIIWCQNGWGDFWHWTPAFFQSTLVILCLMAAFHIPGKTARSNSLRSFMAVITPLVMLSIKIVKGLP